MARPTEVINWIILNIDWLSITAIIILFAVLSVRYFRNKDELNPPSYFLLIFIVVLGMISVLPVLIVSQLMLIVVPQELSPVIVAPIAEELVKGLFVGILARTRLIRDAMDGLIYGAMVGTGFAAVENFLYAYVQLTDSGLAAGLFLVSFRSIFIVIGHPLYTGITGFGIGIYKMNDGGRKYGKLWLAILLHALWNGTSLLSPNYWLATFIGVIILSIIILRYFIRKAQNMS